MVYHELSTNLITFKVHLHLIQLKNISNTRIFSFLANKLFKISITYMCKVLKSINYTNNIFPQTILFYFMHLQLKFDLYEKILSIKKIKFVKISKKKDMIT
jgi:hypothetical protein